MNETTKKESRQMDMLHGKIFKNMLIVALPLAACSIMQQLFNSVGVAVVGRFADINHPDVIICRWQQWGCY